MALKIYKSNLRLTVPVIINSKVTKYVSFQDENHTFSTTDENIQKALENLPLFGRMFKLIRTIDGKKKTVSAQLSTEKMDTTGEENGESGDPESKETYTVYDEITDWQAAKDVLRGEPYHIPYQGLSSPELILKKAEEVRVSFPNLNLN